MEFEIDLLPKIKRLEIFTKKIMETNIVGGYKSAFKGRGLEFEDYREYTSGDDARLIDWKASKRANRLLIKEFVEERNLNVFFLVDTSSSMLSGSTEKLKNEYAAELAASMCYATVSAGDSIGFALFSDNLVDKIRAGLGMKQLFVFTKSLVDPKHYGGRFDLGKAIKFLLTFTTRDSLVILISDFIGFREDYRTPLRLAGKRFDMMAIMVRDPRDRTLPKDAHQVLISDPYTNEQMIIDPDLVRERYEQYVKEEENMIRRTLLESDIELLELTTDKPFIAPVMNFFLRRHSKWR